MKNLTPALLRALRSAVAFGLPYLISILAKSPNPKLVALGPLLMAIGKYLRDTYKWEWLPV